jgi:hypothetical protein
MLSTHLPPMLVANTRSPTPVMLAVIFAVGVYLLYCGITYLREGRIGSRHGTTLTPQKQPKLYWTNVTLAVGGGALMIVTSLAILLYRRLH